MDFYIITDAMYLRIIDAIQRDYFFWLHRN